MEILRDNETSFTLTKNPESQNHTMHINVIHYHIQELVNNKELRI